MSLAEWGQMKSGIRLTLDYINLGTMTITPSSISWWLLNQDSSMILEEQQGMSQMLDQNLRVIREVSLKTGPTALTSNHTTGKLRQEDCYQFKGSLDSTVSTRPYIETLEKQVLCVLFLEAPPFWSHTSLSEGSSSQNCVTQSFVW